VTSLDQEELGSASSLAAPPVAAGEQELAAAVRSAIDSLPGGLRATVLLRVYERLSFEDIGRILERNEAAARKRYSRALAALRDSLGELWREHAGGAR
jgi:DNA-directed RNA polymerase specialized sigma24 family protein